jgi:hypothetical protein
MAHNKRAVRHWRRYLRLSVRGLIVFVLAIAVGTGWIVQEAHMQREAVAAILLGGGRVWYSSDVNARSHGSLPPGWSKLIAEFAGIDYVDHVVDIEKLGEAGDKERWEQAVHRLVDLRGVETMNLMGPSVDDSVLAQLSGMDCLKLLMLQYTTISDRGLYDLRKLKNLEVLCVYGGGNAGARPAHLAGSTGAARALASRRGIVTDAGLAHMAGLTSLSQLLLRGTPVSGAGLVHLTGLGNLSELGLAETKVCDAELAHLKALTNLSSLDLSRTRVGFRARTPERIDQSLSSLDVRRTQVSDVGLEAAESATTADDRALERRSWSPSGIRSVLIRVIRKIRGESFPASCRV